MFQEEYRFKIKLCITDGVGPYAYEIDEKPVRSEKDLESSYFTTGKRYDLKVIDSFGEEACIVF